MREIIIQSKKHGEKRVMLNESDYQILKHIKWYVKRSSHGYKTFYAATWINGKNYTMETFLFPRSNDLLIDHIDRNGLNNQRSNLRQATKSQNQWNRGIDKNNSSGYKGVSGIYRKNSTSYRAYIKIKNKLIRLGHYQTPEEAALVYNEAARKYHGEFAFQNTVPIDPSNIVIVS